MGLPLLLLLTPPLQEADLKSTIAQSIELAEAGKPSEAKTSLLAAIESPEMREQVLENYGALIDQLALLAFQEKYPDPQPNDFLSGEVLRWKARTGQIKVRWEANGDAFPTDDFLVSDNGDYLFPVPVRDGFKIRIKGLWEKNPTPLSILAGCNGEINNGWRFTGGFHQTKSSPALLMPQRLERFGSAFEMLHQNTKKLEEPEGEWAYSLENRRDKFTFRVGNKRIGTFETRFPNKIHGLVGFRAPGVDEVEIEAKVDIEEWKKFQSAALGSRLGKFRTHEYNPIEVLPLWFREMQEEASLSTPMRAIPNSISNVPQEAASAYQEACTLAQEKSWKDCLAKATQARGALDFGPLHAIHAEAAYRIGRYEDSLRDLAEKMASWPIDAGRTWAFLAGLRFGPRERLKILNRVVAAGGVASDILIPRRRLELALSGPKGAETSKYQSANAYILSSGTPEAAAKLGELVENQIRYLSKEVAYSVQAREPATVLHFMSEVEADGFLGSMGLESGLRGYLPALRIIVAVGDPNWSRFQPRILGPLLPWYLETRYDLRNIPPWVIEGFTTLISTTNFDDAGNAFTVVSKAAVADMARNPIGLRRTPAELASLPRSFWAENANAVDKGEAYLLVHFLWTHESYEINGFFRNLFTFLSRGLAADSAYNQALGTLNLEALEEDVKLHRRHLIETYL